MLGRSSASNTQLPTSSNCLLETLSTMSEQKINAVTRSWGLWLLAKIGFQKVQQNARAERIAAAASGKRTLQQRIFSGLAHGKDLGLRRCRLIMTKPCFHNVFIHCQYLTNPTLVFRERQPRSKWLNEKNKMVFILVTTRWSLRQIATTQFCLECPNCKRIFVWNRFCAPMWGLHWVSLPLAYTLAASGEGSFCGRHSLSNLGHSASYMATSVNQRSQTVLVGPNWWETEFIFVF